MKAMKAQTREAELSPEQVIDWLRSDEGERWRRARVGMIYRHNGRSGIFGELIPDLDGRNCPASWPVPGSPYAV